MWLTREGKWGGTREGKEPEHRKSQLTRIFLFAVWLAACTADSAQMSGWRGVVVLATLGDVQGT
jgi:hypothetical protein